MNKKGYFLLSLGIVAAMALSISTLIPGGEQQRSSAGVQWGRASAISPKSPVAAGLIAAWGNAPLRFEANEGQAGGDAQYIARGPGYSVLLGGAEATLVLDRASREAQPARSTPQERLRAAQKRSAERAIVTMELAGANRAAASEGLERLETETNYFIGNDPSKWHRQVANYSRVKYRQVYPGVDLVYYGKEKRLEYDLLVAAGANPEVIRMRYTGADAMRVDADGALVLRVKDSELRQLQPKAYQTVGGVERPVKARYELRGNEVRLALGRYDHNQALVIDPALIYSTYFGGSGDDTGTNIAVDASGNVYLTGNTSSANLPTTGHAFPPFQAALSIGGSNAYVVKLNSGATAVTFCTYLGGNTFDEGDAIAVDATGVYVGGVTASNNFPGTAGFAQAAFGALAGNSNGWLAKLDPNGQNLLYSTYLGGGGNDFVNSLTVDGSGVVYATGSTFSGTVNGGHGGNFPTTAGVVQTTFGGTNVVPPSMGGTGDAFVTKLSADGKTFLYSTYLGGSGDEEGFAILVDNMGNAFIAGDTTTGTQFPTPASAGVIQPGPPAKTAGSHFTGFVAEVNSGATALTYYTYLGGSGDDRLFGMAIDTGGNIYVAGSTNSPNFPLMPNPGAAQTVYGGGASDAFVTKINGTGTAIAYSTYLGGSGADIGADIKVDASGAAYVVGATASGNFPVTANANQNGLAGAQNAFIAKLRPNGTQVAYGSYHGGNGTDTAQKMALDANNFVYFTGTTSSNPFPTTAGVVQAAFGGGLSDAFAAKFDASVAVADLTPAMLTFGNQRINTPSPAQVLTYTNTGNATLTITAINLPTGYTQTNTCGALPAMLAAGASCTISVTFQPNASGPFPGMLTATDNAAGSPRSVTLSGTGTMPIATLSTNMLNFPATNVGSTSASQMVTLTNTGTDTLNIVSITQIGNNPGDFPGSNTCGPPFPATLAPGASCVGTASFAPTNGGARSATVQITDDSNGIANSTQNVSLTGNGIVPAGGTFLLIPASNSVSVRRGQPATFSISVSPVGAFNQSVGVGCSGAPALATCVATPPSVTPNGAATPPLAASTTILITTTAPSSLVPWPQNPGGMPPMVWGLLAALLAALAAARMPVPARARLRWVAPVVLIVGLSVFAAACGTSGSPGTPTGSFPLTITGTGGVPAQTQTVILTLTVTP